MKLLTTFIFIFFMAGSTGLQAQNAKYKALFMYNFTKYIEWPASYRSGDFVIGILGQSPLERELQAIARSRKAGQQRIVVKQYNSIGSIDRCHMIYVPANRSNYLSKVVSQVQGKPTLVVSDGAGLAKSGGSGINFVVVSNRQKFQINQGNITSNGLKVSSGLLNLGIEVR